MLTEQDIQKIVKANKEIFATKEDLDQRFDKAFGVFATKEDIKNLKEDMNGLRESVQILILSTDRLVKSIEDPHQEFIATVAKIDRHEKWIHQIAEKVGVRLEY